MGRQNDNVSIGRVARRMFAAHPFAEIVLRTHLVGRAGLLLCFFIWPSLIASRAQQQGEFVCMYVTTGKCPTPE